jgi:hypothetical protein
MMREHFAKVGKFHEGGFSFVQICAACEKAGLLPKGANPHCFRQTFRREHTRLEKSEELAKQFRETDSGIEEKSGLGKADQLSNAGRSVIKTASEPAVPLPDDEAAIKERIREITRTVVDTGLGKIVKHSDGSFEYN